MSRQSTQDFVFTLLIGASIGAWVVSYVDDKRAGRLQAKVNACAKAYDELTAAGNQCAEPPAVVRLMYDAGSARHLIECTQTGNGNSQCSVGQASAK